MYPRFLTLALALVALLLPAAGWAQAPWVTVDPAGGGFSVQMPVTPTRNASKAPEDMGDVELYVATADREVYLAGWVDYVPSFTFDTQAELAANRDNFLKGMEGATLTGSKARNLGEHPGIEFTGEGPGYFIRSRVYIVGRRPYQLIAVVPAAKAASPNIARFLDSFTLKR